jgi:hypothetical protein
MGQHLYNAINKHPLPSEIFVNELAALGTVTPAEAEAIKKEASADLPKGLWVGFAFGKVA